MAKPPSKSAYAMSEDQPVLVIGGTRGAAGLLIARLLHSQGVPVRVLARDRTRAVTLFDRATLFIERLRLSAGISPRLTRYRRR